VKSVSSPFLFLINP